MFLLSSAASLNLGWSENGVLGNGLNLPNDNFKLLQTEVLTDKRLKFDDNDRKSKQEGHDGPVSLHWLIREIHSYQTTLLGNWFKT